MPEAQKPPTDAAPEALGRIPLRQLAPYAAGGIIPIALFNIAGILVGLMGNISLGLSAFWLGVTSATCLTIPEHAGGAGVRTC
jgi:hypothetical protein